MTRHASSQVSVLVLATALVATITALAGIAALAQQTDRRSPPAGSSMPRQAGVPSQTWHDPEPARVRSVQAPRKKKEGAGTADVPGVSFLPAVTYVSGGQGTYAGSLAVADVNGDGKPDIIVANVVGPCCGSVASVGVLLGNGDGTFQPPILNTSLSQIGEFGALAVADVNGDGRPDLIVTTCCESNGDAEAAVLLGNGDGTFQAPVLYDLGGSGSAIVAADVNGDGKPDIVSTNYNGSNNSTVTVLLGNGDGTFQAPIASPAPDDASCLTVADVNGDGKPDALVCGEFSVAVLLGNGDGTFQSFDNTNFFTGYCTNAPAVADLNGSGLVDMVAPNAGADSCTTEGLVGILLGNGTNTLFQPEVDYAATTNNTVGVGGVAVADVNGDGKPDAIVASGFAFGTYISSIAVLLGDGDGTFQPAILFSTGATGSTSIAAADLNGDGKPDIVTANFDYGGVSVLINNTASFGIPTTTALASGPNPSVYGQSVTFTATVTSSGGTPTGSVIFYNGTNITGSGTLNASGQTSIAVSSLPAGKNSITAVYQGSSTFAGSTSGALIQTVNVATTSTSLSSSLNPAGTGQSVTLTATVSSQYGGALTGSVTFFSGSQPLGSAPLYGTVASLATSFPTAGTYSITAQYTGDPNNSASTSGLVSEKIIASTATTLTSSLNPSVYGQTVTFTATVTSSSGTPPNGESVTFYNGSAILGTGTLSGGTASFATSSLAAGVYSITANYPGDSNFAASTSAVLRQVVNSTTKSATSTLLTSSLNPSIYGQTVTWTAVVTTGGSVPPTGNVNFNWTLWGTTYSIGSGKLNSSGVATLTRSNLNADLYPMSAVYVGDANNLGSASPVVNQVVQQTTSAATLASSPNPSTEGQAVTFTATITSPTVTPTGPVTFAVGKKTLGTAELSKGKAVFTTSTLAAGTTTVTATYNGDSNISGSSASVTEVVEQ